MAVLDFEDSLSTYPIIRGDNGVLACAVEDRNGLVLQQFCAAVAFSLRGGTMTPLIPLVFDSRRPPEVTA